MMTRFQLAAFMLLISISLAGCNLQGDKSREKKENEDARRKIQESVDRLASSAAIRGTIGEQTWIQGMQLLRVRGYGLVVGLNGKGSHTCPQRIRSRLEKSIRSYGFGDSRLGLDDITPEKLIDSTNTAVVLVQGDIPAAALKGTRFDLFIQSLPETETTSLAGGRLYTCDLNLYRQIDRDLVQEGKVIARGAGPVFVDPLADKVDNLPGNISFGKVIGGGVTTEDRRIRLVLNAPSYPMATRIQNRLNDQFGEGDKIALADSPSYIQLKIPSKYLNHEKDFLALVRHFYIVGDASYAQERAQRLAQEIADLKAPHDNISLAFEGLGNLARPILHNLYQHELPHVRFFAARAGLRIGDDRLAVHVLMEHALDPASPNQAEAIFELGKVMNSYPANQALHKIVDSTLADATRFMAFQGLVKQFDPSITTAELGGQFFFDYMPTAQKPFIICIRVDHEPRLALIGQPQLKTPLIYRHPDGVITMNAEAGADKITLVRTTPGGLSSPVIETSLDLADFITLLGSKAAEDRYGQVEGLGLTYPEVIKVLSDLTNNGFIDAGFHLETSTGVIEPIERQEKMPSDRPETDL